MTLAGVEWICHRCPGETDEEFLRRACVMDRAFQQVCAAQHVGGPERTGVVHGHWSSES
jgi:hypothetical protein